MFNSGQVGWVGVDVGTRAVKLAQLIRGKSGVRLHRAAVIQRSASWPGNDHLAFDPPATSQAEIRAALECGGFAGRDAVCLLPMNVCQMRGLNLPPGSHHERRAMASDELADEWAEKRVPMEFDLWESDGGRARNAPDTFNVNVLATPRPWISQAWHDCRKAGLNCWGIDGAPLAMARAAALAGGNRGGQHALVIDWGFSNATLCIAGNHGPLYCRRVHDCAFRLVLEAVMRAFSITLDEAQHLIDCEGFSAVRDGTDGDVATQTAITEAAAETLDELIRQVQRTLRFTEAQRDHLRPASVWLMGGGASIRNVAQHFARALDMPVHIWSVPTESELPSCARAQRAAVFGNAVALSALAWEAA